MSESLISVTLPVRLTSSLHGREIENETRALTAVTDFERGNPILNLSMDGTVKHFLRKTRRCARIVCDTDPRNV